MMQDPPTRSDPPDATVGVLLSGGLDSAILLGNLLWQGRGVRPFYIRSGLAWQREELAAIGRFLAAVASPRLEELVVLDLPLRDVYGRHWSVTGEEAPDAESPDRAVYLPGRNALLVIKAALWCQLHGIEELALGVLGSSPFDDARTPFFENLEAALNCAPASPIRLVRPFAQLDKRGVMALGGGLPLEWTFSCIAPVDGLHCGRCNKCAERIAAFRLTGADDPTRYALANPQSPIPTP
jgi:7-cyano-7-deazaguanine synthase